MPSVSIIIPVYNVEAYLKECLDSLIASSFTDWEAVCIDDGSTDAGGAILDEYSKKDPRFHAVHCSNGGVSQARNIGIELAKAPYLMMLDPDDWIEPSMISNLHTAIYQDHSDLAVCGIFLHRTDGNVSICPPMKKGSVQGYSKIQPSYAEDITPYLWNKLYRREIFLRYNLRFEAGIPINEDLLLNQLYLLRIQSLSIIQTPLYNYRAREGSTVWRYAMGVAPTSYYELIVGVLPKVAQQVPSVIPAHMAKKWIGALFSLALHQVFLNERALFHSKHPEKAHIRKIECQNLFEIFCLAPLNTLKALLRATGVLIKKAIRKIIILQD